MSTAINIIATTISGSIKDWGKIKRLQPLFAEHGETDVQLFAADSHRVAREKTAALIRSGSKIIISAGGSGTFNAVVEGSFDAGCDLSDVRFGFLRKGSADLIGKVLGMPDDVEAAVRVFVESIRANRTVPCDVLEATSEAGDAPPRRFVGYGGAELFGEIPRYTENRFMKYYKGILSQFFGDLGPFLVGTNLAIIGRLPRRFSGQPRRWTIDVDGKIVATNRYQAIIIVNGDLGPNLPFARSQPLGSGRFHLFTFKDLGMIRLPGQLKHAWDASIMNDPVRWGFESFDITRQLKLTPADDGSFPLNIDGSTMHCRGAAEVRICQQIHLISS